MLFFCHVNNGLGQRSKQTPDYMVYDNGDTIYGKFRKPLFGSLSFVSDGNSILPDPKYFKAYYSKSEDRIYRKVLIDQKPYWFALIEDGPIKLYEQLDNNALANGHSTVIRRWAGQKNNGILQEIKSSGPEGINDNGRLNLEYFLSDNQSLYQTLHTTKEYSFKNVRTLIRQYNEWVAMGKK